MSSFGIRKNLANVAIALLLASPATAAPSRVMNRGCVADVVADLSCADSSIMTRCIAIEKVDAELLATCLQAAGCTPDEAENALWITEKCQTGAGSGGDDTQADLEGELRRRSPPLLHGRDRRNMLGRADTTAATTSSATSTSTSSSGTSSTSSSASSSATSSTTATTTSSSSTTATTTTSSASATSTSSSSSVDIGLSSAIVGTVLAVAAVLAFGGVFICAWREGAEKRKAKREAVQKEGLLANMG